MPNHQHRSGALRQTNKKNKRTKASKRGIKAAQGGKVDGAGGSFKSSNIVAQSKLNRRNHASQIRLQRKQELLRQRRGLDGSAMPPRIVGIVSLGEGSGIEEAVREFLLQGADEICRPFMEYEKATVTTKFNVHKKDGQLTVLTAGQSFGAVAADFSTSALDLARICDVIAFVIDANAVDFESLEDIEIDVAIDDNASTTTTGKGKSMRALGSDKWEHVISGRGQAILTALKAQGLPTPMILLAHTEENIVDVFEHDDAMTMQSVKSVRRASLKRRTELKSFASRFAITEFGKDVAKVLEVDLSALKDGAADIISASAALVRTLCTMSCAPSKWVAQSPRPYLVSDMYKYNDHAQELTITGYIRGRAPFNVNSLVHVASVGTFACKSIRKVAAPLQRRLDGMVEGLEVVEATLGKREGLSQFAVPDALDGEQNLVGFEDADETRNDDDDADGISKSTGFARPAGWSDYQSAWLDDAGSDNAYNGPTDHGELADELNRKSTNASIADDGMDLDDANDVNMADRNALLAERKKEQAEHQDFPDEVQVDENQNARDRFARYRSLKSFRKSAWDPKENLPESYATIFHFANFKQTQRTVMNDVKEVMVEAEALAGRFFGGTPGQGAGMASQSNSVSGGNDDSLEDYVPSGTYVAIALEAVASNDMRLVPSGKLLTAVSLLPHENKVSVLHMGLCAAARETNVSVPIKSKDVLTIRCGWREWQARPIFSQNNLNSDKHKFERFIPAPGTFFAASAFGPVTYTPCPVMVFRTLDNGVRELVATGTMLGADADRIVLKRVVLTGYPVRVLKRNAVVKYMFYNPDDVKWFKPAVLYTKHGLEGHIMDSVGEHGTMKCLFNAPIKQHDTVCLPLYKRVYPKFALSQSTVGEDDSKTMKMRVPSLDVR